MFLQLLVALVDSPKKQSQNHLGVCVCVYVYLCVLLLVWFRTFFIYNTLT